MAEPLVLTGTADGVATLTLNRPEKANTLSEAMMDALEEALVTADADPAVRVIVIGANGRIFCAGHDLAEMRAHDDTAYHQALFARCSRLMTGIRRARKPVIAKVQGAAVAAGCQLVASCDLAYAVETAKFGINGIDLGLFCSTPVVALSRAIQPRRALELALTGRLIKAGEAVDLGLVNAAVPADRLDETVAETAALIAAKLPEAIGLGKALFHRQLATDVDAAYAAAGEVMAENMGIEATRRLIDGFVRRH